MKFFPSSRWYNRMSFSRPLVASYSLVCRDSRVSPRSASTTTVRLRSSSLSSSSSPSSSNSADGLANTIATKLDWDDRIGLQGRFSLEEKGWRVKVDWRSTPYGAGLFATQDIPAGRKLRTGILGVNLQEFTSVQDIEDFCNSGGSEDDDYQARLEYVKDYLWGFSKDTDDKGYELNPSSSSDNNSDDRFFGMWIPGNGLNHNEVPNTVYKLTEDGIDLVALVDIQADDELFDDYRRHGMSSPWLKDFADTHNVTLNFADCNEFV